MRTIAKLFGRSPFGPLQSHMEKVAECVELVPGLFDALLRADQEKLEALAQEISHREHAADQVKNDIRNNLPKRLFLPVDRGALLELLAVQDSLADHAEDIGVLLTFGKLEMPGELRVKFQPFLEKNLEAFEAARQIVQELDELVESSFGGPEAEKVKQMVEEVALKEHEADVLQRELIRQMYAQADQMGFVQFYLWNQVFQAVACLSNLSEKLALRLRMMLEIK